MAKLSKRLKKAARAVSKPATKLAVKTVKQAVKRATPIAKSLARTAIKQAVPIASMALTGGLVNPALGSAPVDTSLLDEGQFNDGGGNDTSYDREINAYQLPQRKAYSAQYPVMVADDPSDYSGGSSNSGFASGGGSSVGSWLSRLFGF